MRTGGEILIDCLVQLGCDTAFGVPGESYLAALDAMTQHPEFSFVICRQEGGAAMMADAHARLTGKPGVCFVTRGNRSSAAIIAPIGASASPVCTVDGVSASGAT